MSFKKNLLKWVQRQTEDPQYKMKIKGFKKDWRDGLAFLAMVHSFDPNGFDFSEFKSEEDEKNLKFAFDQALEKFDIDQLLDVDDITDFAIPDDILVITYLTLYYRYYAKNKGTIEKKKRKAKKGGGNSATFDRMKLLVSKKNEERAKGNWKFLKDAVRKIAINFEEIEDSLENEFGDDE